MISLINVPAGAGASFFLEVVSIAVEIDSVDYQGTTLSLSKDDSKAGTTSYPIQFTCSTPGVIYYRFSLKTEPAADIATIKANAVVEFIVRVLTCILTLILHRHRSCTLSTS